MSKQVIVLLWKVLELRLKMTCKPYFRLEVTISDKHKHNDVSKMKMFAMLKKIWATWSATWFRKGPSH